MRICPRCDGIIIEDETDSAGVTGNTKLCDCKKPFVWHPGSHLDPNSL